MAARNLNANTSHTTSPIPEALQTVAITQQKY